MDFCIVEKRLLKAYIEAANRYWALESGGVENWEGYGWSFENYINCLNEDEIDYTFENFDDIVEYDLKKMDRKVE